MLETHKPETSATNLLDSLRCQDLLNDVCVIFWRLLKTEVRERESGLLAPQKPWNNSTRNATIDTTWSKGSPLSTEASILPAQSDAKMVESNLCARPSRFPSYVSREVTLLCRFLTSELPLALLKLVLGPPFSAQTAHMLLHKIFRKA